MNKIIVAALVAYISISIANPALASSSRPDALILRADTGLTAIEALLQKGNYSGALSVTTLVLNRHPRNADAYAYRGYAYMKLGQKDKALDCFTTALQIDPSHLGANKYLANYYLDNGEMSRALEQIEAMRMICVKTDCPEITILEGEINRNKTGTNNTNGK